MGRFYQLIPKRGNLYMLCTTSHVVNDTDWSAKPYQGERDDPHNKCTDIFRPSNRCIVSVHRDALANSVLNTSHRYSTSPGCLSTSSPVMGKQINRFSFGRV